MTWNYRIVKFRDEWDEKEYYGLFEVYYGDDGKPEARTEDPFFIMDEPYDYLELMKVISAWIEPVLKDEIFDGQEE